MQEDFQMKNDNTCTCFVQIITNVLQKEKKIVEPLFQLLQSILI